MLGLEHCEATESGGRSWAGATGSRERDWVEATGSRGWGVSPLDPDGRGHRGIEAITTFYDNVIDSGDVRFHIRESFACGQECANVGTITTRSGDGSVSRCELVMVYRVDDQGALVSLRAFWEFDELVGALF